MIDPGSRPGPVAMHCARLPAEDVSRNAVVACPWTGSDSGQSTDAEEDPEPPSGAPFFSNPVDLLASVSVSRDVDPSRQSPSLNF